jgi:hypothetical protein
MGATFLAKIQPQPCENPLFGASRARQSAHGISQLSSLIFVIYCPFYTSPVLGIACSPLPGRASGAESKSI